MLELRITLRISTTENMSLSSFITCTIKGDKNKTCPETP